MAPREEITLVGTVLSTSFSAPDVLPNYRICLETETGCVDVVWLGRFNVPGISLGRRLQVSGIPLKREDGMELMNPDYQLLGDA